jgi:hypothetical protein
MEKNMAWLSKPLVTRESRVVEEETFERVACLFIRENENTGAKEVLFVRSPSGAVFFIPGGRRIEGRKDDEVLTQKIKLDLGIDLVPETIEKYTSFAAPAFGKEEGTMVENHYFVAEYLGMLKLTPQIYEMEWRPYGHGKDITIADEAVMKRLHSEGII